MSTSTLGSEAPRRAHRWAPGLSRDLRSAWLWAIPVVWTLLVALALWWNMIHVRQTVYHLAQTAARSSLEKDLLHRQWATLHGGVYVPVTDRTPPNAHLAFVAERDITTPSGRALTLMNPAYMTRQVHELGAGLYRHRGHITSLKPIRPENAPDDWERLALEAFERGATEVSAIVPLDGEPSLRLMRPMLTATGCLKCHASQGYKTGDVRGGLSVAVPMGDYEVVVVPHQRWELLAHGGIWGLGLVAFGAGAGQLRRRRRERDRAQAEVRRSEARFRAIFEDSPIAIWEEDFSALKARVEELRCAGVTDLRTYLDEHASEVADLTARVGVVAVNQAGLQIFKVRSREELTRVLPRCFTAESLQVFKEGTIALAGGRTEFRSEIPLVDVDGRPVVCDLTLSVQAGHEDSLSGVLVSLIDITERKRAEESQLRLATAVEHAAETIVITDTEGTILYANAAFEETTGYSRAEALGQNPRMLKSGKQDAQFYRRMWDVLGRRESWQGHFINRRKDGTLYEEEATISPVRDSAGQVTNYVAVKRDVTREVQLEAELRQAQKMEAIGQLAGGVAHDFNNILVATMMRLSFLKEDPLLAPDALEHVKELEAEARRAAGLTRQLLMLSRRSVLEIRVLDVNDVVANLLKMLGRLLGEHITLVFERGNALPSVEADVGMLEQVLMNLVVNARDAMPRGGRITLVTETVHLDAERASANPLRRQGTFACLTVSDTGCGMDAATLQHIFEPFFTTKETGKGTGLGLATVHGIVTQHRGWLEVESQVGEGTTFRVYLPASTSPAKEAEHKGLQAVPTGKETILVVEDEAMVRELLGKTLRALGYLVLEAPDGQAAMALWRQHGQQISLLLTDMVMPEGMTGLELAERVRAERPDLKIIISSGYTSDLAEPRALAEAGIVYLPKPYQASQLGKVVRECLDGK